MKGKSQILVVNRVRIGFGKQAAHTHTLFFMGVAPQDTLIHLDNDLFVFVFRVRCPLLTMRREKE